MVTAECGVGAMEAVAIRLGDRMILLHGAGALIVALAETLLEAFGDLNPILVLEKKADITE